MSSRHPVVFLMPEDPRRDQLWTPQAQMLAERLGMDVCFADEADGPDVLRGAEAVITSWRSPRLEGVYLKAADELRIVGHAAGSVQAIVSPELFERRVPVVSANAEMAACVAQWSLMMTMVAARGLLSYSNLGEHRALQWRCAVAPRGIHQLTIGIWGDGSVARRFVRLLQNTGAERILVCSDRLSEQAAAAQGLCRVDLPEMFERSDILHLMESLTPERAGRIDAGLLGRLTDGATLINSARAHLVEESALLRELTSGRLNACLDVYHQEPLPEDDVLRSLPNVVLTPHNAGNGSRDRFVPLLLREFDRCFRGLPLEHEITPEHAAAMTCEAVHLGNSPQLVAARSED